MNVFNLRNQLIEDYSSYIDSFIQIRDELRYILDQKDVHGEDFPGETFRVLREKEIHLYGEFRTRWLVFVGWDRLQERKRKDEG
jgi:hypothetical protein